MRVRPKKELGQHFLVDENILGVIGRLAELDRDDVVLEIGPGLGPLTAFLADRVARVVAVELDRSLEPQLSERFGAVANVGIVFGDALALDLAAVSASAARQWMITGFPSSTASSSCSPKTRRWSSCGA